jgi:hypothetical protein
VGGFARRQRIIRERVATGVDRTPTDQMFRHSELVAESSRDGVEDTAGLKNDLGTNPVAGQEYKICLHDEYRW